LSSSNFEVTKRNKKEKSIASFRQACLIGREDICGVEYKNTQQRNYRTKKKELINTTYTINKNTDRLREYV